MHPFFKAVSYLIAPLSVCIFNNARTVAVYRDMRIMSTFKTSIHLVKGEGCVMDLQRADNPVLLYGVYFCCLCETALCSGYFCGNTGMCSGGMDCFS